jgi:carbamoyltransferase
MIVLGIIDSKPSAAALMVNGKIVSAIAEERLCRMKLASGMPRAAIREVIRQASISPEEISTVAIAQEISVYEPHPIPWSGWFEEGEKAKTKRFDNLSARLAPLVGQFPVSWKAHHQLKRFLSKERIQKIPEVMRDEYGIQAPIQFYNHHYAHATTAYYTSGFEHALVVTLDGGGDGLSGSVYIGKDGLLEPVTTVDSYNSLGNFYSYITHLCGFKAEKHEGKVTGLAALGRPIYVDILREFIRFDPHRGQIRYQIPMYHWSAIEQIQERLPKDFDRADLAASVQLLLEEVGVGFIRYWLQKTGLRDVAVAGGVFANVKFNQRIHDLDEVERFFVHPAMDDSGLSVGAAMAVFAEDEGFDPRKMVQRLNDVFFGPSFHQSQIEEAISGTGLEVEHIPNIQRRIAELLSEGNVVARFTGPMEYGPRALGDRSILYQTTDPSVNDWLNENLQRTEFMPFAPATLIEYAHECYENYAGAEDSARFMTITFNCTEKMKMQSPGVVHADGTARPQLLDAETAPDFYEITGHYHQITGIPSLINTSFNMHGEPIVCTPRDAMRSFQQGNLDYLAIGNILVKNSKAIQQRILAGQIVETR